MNAQVGKAVALLGALEQRGAQWSITSAQHLFQLTVIDRGAVYTVTFHK